MDLNIFKNIDKHLAINMIRFCSDLKIYDEHDINLSLLRILSETHGIDDEIDYFLKVNDTNEVPRVLQEKREKIISGLNHGEKSVAQVFAALIKNKSKIMSTTVSNMVYSRLQSEFDADFPSLLCFAFDLVQFKYDIGKYEESYRQLELIHPLICFADMTRYVKGFWGKLACSILLRDFSKAETHLMELKEVLGQVKLSPAKSLIDQIWFYNWALFVYCRSSEGLVRLIEMYVDSNLGCAVVANCPYLLRYLAVATCLNFTDENAEILTELKKSVPNYEDCILSFLDTIKGDLDLQTLAGNLKNCMKIIKADYFVHDFADEFYRCSCLHILMRTLSICLRVKIKDFKEVFELVDADMYEMISSVTENYGFNVRVDYRRDEISLVDGDDSKSVGLFKRVNNVVSRLERLITE